MITEPAFMTYSHSRIFELANHINYFRAKKLVFSFQFNAVLFYPKLSNLEF